MDEVKGLDRCFPYAAGGVIDRGLRVKIVGTRSDNTQPITGSDIRVYDAKDDQLLADIQAFIFGSSVDDSLHEVYLLRIDFEKKSIGKNDAVYEYEEVAILESISIG